MTDTVGRSPTRTAVDTALRSLIGSWEASVRICARHHRRRSVQVSRAPGEELLLCGGSTAEYRLAVDPASQLLYVAVADAGGHPALDILRPT